MEVVVGTPTVFEVSFGPAWVAVTTVGYTLKNLDGSVMPLPAHPRTSTGIVEIGGGFYAATLTFEGPWSGIIYWDTSPGSNVNAQEDVTVVQVPTISSSTPTLPSKLDLTQVGPMNTPQEIKRLRRQNLETCKRLGQPAVFRHMWNLDDVKLATAKQCPACYDTQYNQVRNDCGVCFGIGFVSVENNTQGLYIDTFGEVVSGDPGTGVKAPRYGGFSEPHLTWLIEPDVAVDVFRLTDQGVMIRTYDAQGVAPWYPKLGDNDLCVNVEISKNGESIISTGDRFQLKMTQQVTVRGFGKRSTTGQQIFLVAQTFQMSHVPLSANNILESVPVNAS